MESVPDSEELTDWERIQSPSNSSVAVKEGLLGESSVFLQSSSPGGDRRWSLKRLHSGSVLRGWIPWIGLGVRNKAVLRVGVWSFALATGAVAALVLVSFLHRRMLVWEKNLQLNKSKESLLALIKDKEKRIHQLLLQIAQMNELLRSRRRVRVLQADRLS